MSLFAKDSSTADSVAAQKEMRRTKAVYAAIFTIPLLICAVTNSILGKNLVPVGENVDAAAQIKYVLTHIPDTFMIVVRSVVNSTAQWFSEMTGDFLGELNIRTLPGITLILLLMLYISARDMKLPAHFNSVRAKWIFGLSFFTGYAMILGILYVSWTAVGYYIIRGIQGRYYIALLPALGLFIASLYSDHGIVSMHDESDKKAGAFLDRSGIILKTHILLVLHMIVIVDIYKYLTVN